VLWKGRRWVLKIFRSIGVTLSRMKSGSPCGLGNATFFANKNLNAPRGFRRL
jgi:hypothetical protein